jgi:UDPglucose--hexose-1-phosphate uridylyltransferase
MPEFRKDPVVDRWVIIAPERANRPKQQNRTKRSRRSGACPFCAGNEAMTPPEVLIVRKPRSGKAEAPWIVRVVPNMYPAVVTQGSDESRTSGLFEAKDGIGAHEVIIESPDHLQNTAALSEARLASILNAYRQRMIALGKDNRWRFILIYKNEGLDAGATLEHIHSQLVALPMIPKEASQEFDGAARYYDQNRRCIYCDMIRAELDVGSRVISESPSFIALCPYAPRFAFETWIFPKQHFSSFAAAPGAEQVELARTLQETLIRLARGCDRPPFNYVLHSGPVQDNVDYYHWHLKIMPRLAGVAGFEWGSGFFINTTPPEDAARILREALR